MPARQPTNHQLRADPDSAPLARPRRAARPIVPRLRPVYLGYERITQAGGALLNALAMVAILAVVTSLMMLLYRYLLRLRLRLSLSRYL